MTSSCWTGLAFSTTLMALPGIATPQAARPGGRAQPEQLVAEAQIWGGREGARGYSFLPVTIHGHRATVVIDLRCTECDLSLSIAALTQAGVALPGAVGPTLDSITIGARDVQRDVPLSVITKPTWHVPGPDSLPLVVGIVGVHFLTTRYDILYDFPRRRVRLYALPLHHPVAPYDAWLPPGFTPADCGPMIHVPPGAETFTGVKMLIDGHPITGVIEMGPYVPKMDASAFRLLGLPAGSPRIEAVPLGSIDGGHVLEEMVRDVPMTVGTNTFGTWETEVLHELDVQSLLPSRQPVMLMNLNTFRRVMLYNAVSSGQVCVSRP